MSNHHTQFCRYKQLPFGADLAGDMFQKIDEIFKEVPNVFGIEDNILVVGYDSNGADHDRMLCKELQICRK